MTLQNFSFFFCSGFGVGNLKYFPGTFASLSILPLIWFLREFQTLFFYIILIIVYSIISFIFIKFCIKT